MSPKQKRDAAFRQGQINGAPKGARAKHAQHAEFYRMQDPEYAARLAPPPLKIDQYPPIGGQMSDKADG